MQFRLRKRQSSMTLVGILCMSEITRISHWRHARLAAMILRHDVVGLLQPLYPAEV